MATIFLEFLSQVCFVLLIGNNVRMFRNSMKVRKDHFLDLLEYISALGTPPNWGRLNFISGPD